jgi:hypothetical protein
MKTRRVVRRRGSHIFYTIAPAALYPHEDSRYSFLLEAESTPGHSAAGEIRSIEKSNDLIGNRTRDLPACGIVPQPTTLPRAPHVIYMDCIILQNIYWVATDYHWSADYSLRNTATLP